MTGVIGAGLTGLALSAALARRGVEHVVFEADARPGGVIRSTRVDGIVLEEGPQRMRLVAPVRRLVEQLGLNAELLLAPDLKLLILTGGKLHAMPRDARELARSSLLPFSAKLRLLTEPLAGPPRHEETAGAYLRRRFGRPTYDRLLAPLFGGLYASDPDTMLARHALAPLLRDLGIERSVLPALLRGALRGRSRDHTRGPMGGRGAHGNDHANESRTAPRACSFRDGLGSFVAALHRHVASHVRLGTAARSIERRNGRWVIRTDDSDHVVDTVVISCPADAAASILHGCAPVAAGALRSLTYNPIALVHMRADLAGGESDHARAAGYQVAHTEPLRTRGVTFNHALFGRDNLVTAFLGGHRDRHVHDESDQTLTEQAEAEFQTVTGQPANAVHISRTRIPAWDASWTALDALRLPDGVHLCSNYEPRVGISGRIAAAERLAEVIATVGGGR